MGFLFLSKTQQLSSSTNLHYNPQSQPLLAAKPFLILYTSKNLTHARTLENWLYAIHNGVGCKTDFVGSHVVDVAYNSGKSVKVPEWKTQGELPRKIFTAKYDSRMSNTSETQDSGTSGHKHNLNPGCYKSLSNIHSIIVCMKWSVTRMKVYDNVQN